jgi:hypothetical protein
VRWNWQNRVAPLSICSPSRAMHERTFPNCNFETNQSRERGAMSPVVPLPNGSLLALTCEWFNTKIKAAPCRKERLYDCAMFGALSLIASDCGGLTQATSPTSAATRRSELVKRNKYAPFDLGPWNQQIGLSFHCSSRLARVA